MRNVECIKLPTYICEEFTHFQVFANNSKHRNVINSTFFDVSKLSPSLSWYYRWYRRQRKNKHRSETKIIYTDEFHAKHPPQFDAFEASESWGLIYVPMKISVEFSDQLLLQQSHLLPYILFGLSTRKKENRIYDTKNAIYFCVFRRLHVLKSQQSAFISCYMFHAEPCSRQKWIIKNNSIDKKHIINLYLMSGKREPLSSMVDVFVYSLWPVTVNIESNKSWFRQNATPFIAPIHLSAFIYRMKAFWQNAHSEKWWWNLRNYQNLYLGVLVVSVYIEIYAILHKQHTPHHPRTNEIVYNTKQYILPGWA